MDIIDCDSLIVEENEFSKGSFAKVYKGSYFGNPVCVKVVKKDTLIDKELIKFLNREIDILKEILYQPHKNIVRFIGIGEKDSLLFIVTELINGGDLGNILLNESFHLPWSLRIKMAKDIAEGMDFLHSKKIMHRDLKSNNLLLGKNWTVKICDFGFAKQFVQINNPLSQTICGTDEFMSPEVILGINYNFSADVYSFGMVLLEIITRNKLEERLPQNNFDIDYEELQNKIPSDCPREFLEIAMKCCNYEPKDRPSFIEVIEQLDQLILKLIKDSPDGPYPETPVVVSNPHFDEQSLNDWCMLSLIPDDCLENLNEFSDLKNNKQSLSVNNSSTTDQLYNDAKSNLKTSNNNCKLCENCQNHLNQSSSSNSLTSSPQSVKSSYSNSSIGSTSSTSSKKKNRKSWKCLIN